MPRLDKVLQEKSKVVLLPTNAYMLSDVHPPRKKGTETTMYGGCLTFYHINEQQVKEHFDKVRKYFDGLKGDNGAKEKVVLKKRQEGKK